MKVSVIVPVFKGERTLDNCLDSLEDQTIPKNSYEVLTVVDKEGYNKKTEEILNSHKIRVIFSPKRLYYGGIRNLSIKNTKGEVIAFIDQDCYASNRWIEVITKDFENYDVEMVYGKRKSLWENTKFKRFKELEYTVKSGKAQENEKRIFSKNNWKEAYIVSGQNMAFKREICDKYGFFDEQYGPYGSEDLVFQFKLLLNNVKIMFDPEMLVTHDHPLNFFEWLRKSYYYGVGNNMVSKKKRIILKNKWIRQYFPGICPRFTSPRDIFSKMKPIPSVIDFIEFFSMESTDYFCKMLARFTK